MKTKKKERQGEMNGRTGAKEGGEEDMRGGSEKKMSRVIPISHTVTLSAAHSMKYILFSDHTPRW